MLLIVFCTLLFSLISIFVMGIVLRKRLHGRHRVSLTIMLAVGVLIILPLGLYSRVGQDQVEYGMRNHLLTEEVRDLETYFDSQAHAKHKDEHFSICLLGDSTHYYKLAVRDRMLPQFQQRFPKDIKDNVEIYGFSFSGLDAFEYYFLVNWIVDEKPDLVVIPVNLRAFAPMWANDELMSFSLLERYIRLSEIPVATSMSNRTHHLSWERILLRKLDYLLFGSEMGYFSRGLKRAFDDRKKKFCTEFQERLAGIAIAIPPRDVPDPGGSLDLPARRFIEYIPRDHEMLRAFRELNRVAYKNGIDIVYYSVQMGHTDIKQDENFELVREVLTQDPGVHFITMLHLLEPAQFLEDEHPTREGMKIQAARLAREVGDLVRQKINGSTNRP